MNRRQRRAADAALQWFRLEPKGDYEQATAELGNEAMAVLLCALRGPMGGAEGSSQFSDADLFNSNMSLIRCGYLDLFIAFDDRGIHVRPELKLPGSGTLGRFWKDNDNRRDGR